jgi:hypothetical protein
MAPESPEKSTRIGLFLALKPAGFSTVFGKPFDPHTYDLHKKWCKTRYRPEFLLDLP